MRFTVGFILKTDPFPGPESYTKINTILNQISITRFCNSKPSNKLLTNIRILFLIRKHYVIITLWSLHMMVLPISILISTLNDPMLFLYWLPRIHFRQWLRFLQLYQLFHWRYSHKIYLDSHPDNQRINRIDLVQVDHGRNH